jgi:hypothetical protein
MKKYFLSLLLLLLLPGISAAESYSDDESYHSHQGFYFNLALGYASDETIIENVNGEEYRLTGTAWVCRLRLGGSIVENLLFFGVLGISNQVDPDLDSALGSGQTSGVTIRYTDIGVGLAYYFMPMNFYFSTSFARTISRWETGSIDADSEPGFSVTFSLGKEWWAGDETGIGIAILASFARMKPGEEIAGAAYASERMHHSYAAIAVSLSYN